MNVSGATTSQVGGTRGKQRHGDREVNQYSFTFDLVCVACSSNVYRFPSHNFSLNIFHISVLSAVRNPVRYKHSFSLWNNVIATSRRGDAYERRRWNVQLNMENLRMYQNEDALFTKCPKSTMHNMPMLSGILLLKVGIGQKSLINNL